MSTSRIIRGEFLSLREKEFVEAARAIGASDRRIIFKHMLPNVIGSIIVSATLIVAIAILAETALSYLGLGVKLPDSSLGLLVSLNQTAFTTRPWLFWYPGVFILLIAITHQLHRRRGARRLRSQADPGARLMAELLEVERPHGRLPDRGRRRARRARRLLRAGTRARCWASSASRARGSRSAPWP